jgi:signal transduction histidine kinase
VFAHTPEVGEVLMETLATRSPVAAVPLTLRRRNGTGLPVEFGTAPLKAGEGKDLGVVGMFRDLSVVHQLETELRRSDRLAALGTVAAGLAHEIKNPLTSLLTFSRHLERKFDDAHFRERFQRVVPRELERINGIVERLLELTRPARLSFQPVRLPAVLDRALELYANEIEAKHVRVVREYARDLAAVHADAEHLYQAIVNLVGNALEAMSARGHLTVRAGWSEPGAALLAARRAHGLRAVKIEIADDGVGIPPSDADRVFYPFFTTKDGGTGLGLALAHKIIEDHGGAIDFQSAPGLGTTFRITLPIRPPVPAARLDADLEGR